MKFIADLHIHSYLSRACSKDLTPENLFLWCQLKGVTVLSTGDFTHPQWRAELREKLTPAEPGLFELKPELAQKPLARVTPSCRGPVRFLLGVEISCIYKKKGRVRKAHHLVFAPSFDVADKLSARLEKIGNIRSDGRPILGLDSKDLLSIVLETSSDAFLIPAHAWTPHFSIFGSESGFDSLEESFEDLTSHIFAIETGLSSDPAMNWRLSALDNLALISNSDAHSPEKIAREANVLDTELSYGALFEAFRTRDPKRFLGTLEFYPEEGKYHLDGHRKCQTRMTPDETVKRDGRCTVCEKPVTVGVLHRVEKLADRPLGGRPAARIGFENLIPLKEVIGETLDVGPAAASVDRLYFELLSRFGNELSILRELSIERLTNEGFPRLAQAIDCMRHGRAQIEAGYDGEYGTISLSHEADAATPQLALL